MSTINDGGSAFPHSLTDEARADGLTIRDYFAAKAMQVYFDTDVTYKCIAKAAYEMADAMLEARK